MAFPKGFFTGKNIFITGGSSGLGKAIGIVVAEQGANVVIIARDTSKLEQAKDDILKRRQSDNQHVESYSVDLGDATAVDEFIKSCPQTPDLLFCVAGGAKKENGFFVDLQEDQFKACLNNNYFASVFISQACLRLWLAEDEVEQRTKGTRRIVFVSSKAAFVGLPGYTAYTTAKVAVRALADTLRQEVLLYGKDRFKIHCAFPGSYMTEAFLADKVELPELTKILEGIDSDKEELAKKKPSPADMAGLILRAVVRGDFMITTDLQGSLLLNNMRGPSPRNRRLLDLLQSLIVVPIWALYRRLFDQKTSNYGESLRKSA